MELFSLRTDPSIPVIKPTSTHFITALDYHYYRFNNTSPRFPSSLTGKLTIFSKRLKAHISIVSVTGRDSISILSIKGSLLKSYKTSCDHSLGNEGLAFQMLLAPWQGSTLCPGRGPEQAIIAYMRQSNVSYPKFINFYSENKPVTKRSWKPKMRSKPSNEAPTKARPLELATLPITYVIEPTGATAPTGR